MTEAEFNRCNDPHALLNFIAWAWQGDHGSLDRKARLFSVACSRRIWDQLPDHPSREAVQTAEAFADGQVSQEELERTCGKAQQAADGGYTDHRDNEFEYDPDAPYPAAAAYFTASPRLFPRHEFSRGWRRGGADGTAYYAAQAVGQAAVTGLAADDLELAWDTAGHAEYVVQCQLLRCIFGPSLFRLVNLNRSLLTPDIVALAADIYETRDAGKMPALAALLEAAGATDAELLSHLRSGGPHAGRGCWALDAVLGRE